MKKELLIGYTKNINKSDIEKYLTKEFITYTDEEVSIIYNAIHNDYELILDGDFMSYITKYQDKLNKELYLKIIEKYNQYKSLLK